MRRVVRRKAGREQGKAVRIRRNGHYRVPVPPQGNFGLILRALRKTCRMRVIAKAGNALGAFGRVG